MQSHLTIKANGKHIPLPQDFSIDIDYNNPMFNDYESFSYPCAIPIKGNGAFLKNVADRKSPLRPVSLENTKARIYADGLPVFDGNFKTSDGEEITESVSMNIEGGKTLSALISDLDCRDIPVKDELLIGRKIGDVSVTMEGSPYIAVYQDGPDFFFRAPKETTTVQFSPQALGFSRVETANINVDKPYPQMPYCNARVAYKHYALGEDGKTSERVDETGLYGAYYVLDANRQQSGMCFYVLYFLDCLFHHLGLDWDNSELTAIEDMKRLCFFTTHCKYDEVKENTYVTTVNPDPDAGLDVNAAFKGINAWLSEKSSGAELSLHAGEMKQVNSATIPKGSVCVHVEGSYDIGITGNDMFRGKKLTEGIYVTTDKHAVLPFKDVSYYPNYCGTDCAQVFVGYDLPRHDVDVKVTRCEYTVSKMYANSMNFPDASVSTVLESLENQFGIRFVYDAERKSVKARLLRNIYRSQDAAKQFLGTVHSISKLSEKITGVRIGYDSESDAKDQRNNLRDSVRDYDTAYDYIDYPADGKGASAAGLAQAKATIIETDAYKHICAHATNTNNNVYVDLTTGNSYRIKVDSEASSSSELKPAWFEVGQFHSVEFGDCSADNEDFIKEMTSSFVPLLLSDVNTKRTVQDPGSTDKDFQPLMTPFIDEDMLNENDTQYLDYPADIIVGDLGVRAKMTLAENYDVSASDDGNSPLQSYDWGLAIAIMRGGGTDATNYEYDHNYDGFGNSKWGTVAGTYSMDIDSINIFGAEYDYNGTQTGIGTGERFSLKPRGYRPITWKDTPQCRADSHGSDGWHYVRNRGYVDRFLYEHAYFLVNRRKFLVRAAITPAMLQHIRNNWTSRWRILDETGFINKVSVQIDLKEGIGEAEIEFYAL